MTTSKTRAPRAQATSTAGRAVLLSEAQTEKELAEKRFFDANARVALALAKQEEISLRIRERAEKEVLSRDEYNNVYVFDQDVDDESVKDCVQTLTGWVRKNKDAAIEIQINTNGGDIVSGFALVDFIRDIRRRGIDVTIVVYGQAASMGAVILQAADTRVMGENSLLLLHEGSMLAAGDWGRIEDNVKLFGLLQTRILSLLSGRSNMTAQQIKNKWKRTDWWITAGEALEHGFVDEVR